MKYQRYWDDREYLNGLRDEIEAAVTYGIKVAADPRVITAAVMSQVFDRVQLRSWCGRENCFKSWCSHTHYRFEISTNARAFEPSEEGP